LLYICYILSICLPLCWVILPSRDFLHSTCKISLPVAVY
jgi:hypothetical protein